MYCVRHQAIALIKDDTLSQTAQETQFKKKYH